MNLWQEDASSRAEHIGSLIRNRPEVLDFVAAVKGLHELNPDRLLRLIKDSGNRVVRYVSEDGTQVQVDFEKLAKNLPLHLIAVIMAWERNESTFQYLLCGIILLHCICELGPRLPKIEQILFDDVKVSEQVIDLVCYLLVVLAAYAQENHGIPDHVVLLHAALVASSLKLLTVIISSQYQEVAQVIISYQKVDIFLDVAFSSVCADAIYLQDMLSSEDINDLPSDHEKVIHLCHQCDSSLLIMELLCQQNLFRECVISNKEFCSNGGVLMLIHVIMNLKHIESSYVVPIFRLKSKALSILLYLCEAEKVSYLDEVFSYPKCQDVAKSVAQQVLDILKEMFSSDPKYPGPSSEAIYLRAQVELNAMRLADVFSDDTNFRSFIMINFTEALASMFSQPHGRFVSDWCSSSFPAIENETALDVPGSSYAHQRSSLLVKVVANLHCSTDVCPDEKNKFLKDFARFLETGPQRIADGSSSTSDAGKTANVRKNLRLLLSHAESLVPGYLNEEDIKLLRLFTGQFEALCAPAAEDMRQVAWNSEASIALTPLASEAARDNRNDTNIEESTAENVAFQPVELLNVSRDGNDQSVEKGSRFGAIEREKSINVREAEKDSRAVETSGSDSSPIGRKSSIDRTDDHVQGSGNDDPIGDEKVDAGHSDDRQQRKRKRTVMNDKQIALIESAIIDEPDMHRNAASLRTWAEKLSLYGAEVTTSRLKNWLNNRKAKLARAAKDARASHEGNNPERQGASGHLDSPQSPMDNPHTSSKGSSKNELSDTPFTSMTSEDVGSSLNVITQDSIQRPATYLEPGQHVALVGEKSDKIGKGKVFQSRGKWFEENLDQSNMCVVDITELSVDIHSKLPYPIEATGNSFYQAEKKFGLVRVLWDVNKIVQLPSAQR